MRLAPGNEALKYAEKIIALVHKYDEDEAEVTAQLNQDGLDIEELLKNDKAIMGGIVSMSKLIRSMHDSMMLMMKGESSGKESNTDSTGTPEVRGSSKQDK